MYIKGYITLENSILIPIFILIFMSLISITGYYHDKLVIKGAADLVCVKLENVSKDNIKSEIEIAKQQIKKYIEKKTLFMKKISVEVKNENGVYSIECMGEYKGLLMKLIGKTQMIKSDVSVYNPSNMIRIAQAAMEVIDK